MGDYVQANTAAARFKADGSAGAGRGRVCGVEAGVRSRCEAVRYGWIGSSETPMGCSGLAAKRRALAAAM